MTLPRTLLPPSALVAAILAIAWPAAAQDTVTVTITKSDCTRLVKHVPAPDVTYRPGVDVYGREVAPADLDGGARIAVPETIQIVIEVDLQDRFGIPANRDVYAADAMIGEVVVDAEGRATFNGQPLQNEAQVELARRCQEILYGQP